MRTCVDFIIENNCPDPLICSINCASDGSIDKATTKVIPFNNYGESYLRVRTCLYKVHEQRLERYATIQQGACKTLSDFEVCSRLIPPNTFVPVALPINTTYIEIDNCNVIGTSSTDNQTYSCDQKYPARVYGNSFLFPRSFDVAQTNTSVCTTDCKILVQLGILQYLLSVIFQLSCLVLIFSPCRFSLADCLGSFCDLQYQPSICSPKTIKQVFFLLHSIPYLMKHINFCSFLHHLSQATGTGANYMAIG